MHINAATLLALCTAVPGILAGPVAKIVDSNEVLSKDESIHALLPVLPGAELPDLEKRQELPASFAKKGNNGNNNNANKGNNGKKPAAKGKGKGKGEGKGKGKGKGNGNAGKGKGNAGKGNGSGASKTAGAASQTTAASGAATSKASGRGEGNSGKGKGNGGSKTTTTSGAEPTKASGGKGSGKGNGNGKGSSTTTLPTTTSAPAASGTATPIGADDLFNLVSVSSAGNELSTVQHTDNGEGFNLGGVNATYSTDPDTKYVYLGSFILTVTPSAKVNGTALPKRIVAVNEDDSAEKQRLLCTFASGQVASCNTAAEPKGALARVKVGSSEFLTLVATTSQTSSNSLTLKAVVSTEDDGEAGSDSGSSSGSSGSTEDPDAEPTDGDDSTEDDA